MSVVLPAPFGPDDRGQRALGHLDVDVPEDGLLAVGDGEVRDLDRRVRQRLCYVNTIVVCRLTSRLRAPR